MRSSQLRLLIFGSLLTVGAFAVVGSHPVIAQSNSCYYNSSWGQWVCGSYRYPYYGGYGNYYPYYGYGYYNHPSCTYYYYPYAYYTYSPYYWYHYGYSYSWHC